MIAIVRGPEPDKLRKVRLAELKRLLDPAARKTHPHPNADEIGTKYNVVAEDLWRTQLFKCCYCEHKIPLSYNDVEHRRPKARANRRPGSTETHGYWWLAFTWSNLLFACPACNRSRKRDQFPLDVASIALAPKQPPPGKEVPLLLDPAEENGVEHIEFVFTQLPAGARLPAGVRKHWWPRARRGSRTGDFTIRVCGLDAHVELYDDHVNKEVRRVAEDLLHAIAHGNGVAAAFDRALRLLHPAKPFVGLSYDALRALVSSAKLAEAKLTWPEPHDVGRGWQP
jgi:hypothetical protein